MTITMLRVFIDGSALGNGKACVRAGYAAVFPERQDLNIKETLSVGSGGEEPTNNRAEFSAFLRALQVVQNDSSLKLLDVYTDSKLLIDSVTKWMQSWKHRGWRKSDGSNVLNGDLLKAIDGVLNVYKARGVSVKLHHVLAHTGNTDELSKWNDVVDKMAKEAAAMSQMNNTEYDHKAMDKPTTTMPQSRETFEGIIADVNRSSPKVTRIKLNSKDVNILYFPPEATPSPEVIKDKMVPLFLKGGTIKATCTLMSDGKSWAIKEVSVRAPLVTDTNNALMWTDGLVKWMTTLKDLRKKDANAPSATKLGCLFKLHELKLKTVFRDILGGKSASRDTFDVLDLLINEVNSQAQTSHLLANAVYVLRRVKEVYIRTSRFHMLMNDVNELGHLLDVHSRSRPTEQEVQKLTPLCEDYETFRSNPFDAYVNGNYREGETARIKHSVLDAFAVMYNVPLETRIVSAASYHLKRIMEDEGHTCYPFAPICTATRALLSTEDVIPETIEKTLRGSNRIVIEGEMLYLSHVHKKECVVADAVSRLIEAGMSVGHGHRDLIEAYENEKGIRFHSLQRTVLDDLFAADNGGIFMLTGGPGTGKSSVVQCIWDVAAELGLKVQTCAPTGKAANRLGAQAETIHRMLGCTSRESTETKRSCTCTKGMLVCTCGAEKKQRAGFAFIKNKDNPILTDILIVDEVSMLDLDMAYRVLDALPTQRKVRVLLLGDENQLPSVSFGNVLRDLLNTSGIVPNTHLTKIFRQGDGSLIALLGKCIMRGKVPDPSLYFTGPDVTLDRISDPRKIHKRVLELYMESSRSPLQILVPTKKGDVGTHALNATIHRYIYKKNVEAELRFETGERIIVIKNCYSKNAEGEVILEESVFNGECGIFNRDVGKKAVEITVDAVSPDSPTKTVEVDRDAIDFGYSITVNKSQGSEYETVVIVLHESHGIMLNREVLYTGVTRAKRRLHIIGTETVLERAIRNRCPPRFSGLTQRITENFDVVDM